MGLVDSDPGRLGVLICDNFDAMRAALRDVVELSPRLRVVGEVRNGAEAIDAARRLEPDVILLDLAMPVMTGFEALPELRSIVPNARIVVISALTDSTVEERVRAAGADQYLAKDARIEEILAAIDPPAA